MLQKIIGYSCLMLTGMLGLLALLTLGAMVRALAVSNTLAAVESAFGCFVLCLLLMLAARTAGLAGKARVHAGGLAKTRGGDQNVAKPAKKDL